MRALFTSLGFLTIFPVRLKNQSESDFTGSVKYFPVIGLFIGLILAAANKIFMALNFNPFISSVGIIFLLTIITGAIHLDGLADTADAIFSGKDREGMLKIMRDPAIGTMGAVSLIFMLMAQCALLYSIKDVYRFQALILMCVLSRYAMVFAMFLSPYVRSEGKAKIFMTGVNNSSFIISTFIACIASLAIMGFKGIIVFLIIVMANYVFNGYFKLRIGGITGDILGAINELNEILILFIIYLTLL